MRYKLGAGGGTARHFVFVGLEREVTHCPQLSEFNPPDSHLPMGSCSGGPGSPPQPHGKKSWRDGGSSRASWGVQGAAVGAELGVVCAMRVPFGWRAGSVGGGRERCPRCVVGGVGGGGCEGCRGGARGVARAVGSARGGVCVCEVPAGGAGAILLAHDWQRGNLPSRLVLSLRPPLN